MSNNCWIEWKGGEMPVERGTLVDVRYNCGAKTVGVSAGMGNLEAGFVRKSGDGLALFWERRFFPGSIVAYRLHQEEKPELEQAVPTLDYLMHAWQKAKANADTSRNILKLAEQDEAAARKALDDALRADGWDETAKNEPLNITDWRDLKQGDIVWWSGDIEFIPNEYSVTFVDLDYKGACAFRVRDENGRSEWVNTVEQQWRFIRRPA